MLIFPYDLTETPPVPVIVLQVCPPRQRERARSFHAKVDSGSGITIIPESLATTWDLENHGTARVMGFDGTVSEQPRYRVDIIIGSRVFPNFLVAATDRRFVLLGRDVLNQLSITHDGLRQQVRIHYVRPRRK